ncbi:MAG: CBS domain-containing protein [Nitrosarchaeum sp.]|nr:CBS domain-containing protein [Nitrosarchaeum sp.]
MTSRDIMTKSVIAVDSSITANEAAKMMEDVKVGAIIVMENNTPMGIITDRDFAVKVVSHAYQISTPVKQIMSTPLIAIGPDESIWMVADLMYTRGIRKLPVIEDDKVIGIITSTDLVNQLAISTNEDIRKMYHESIIKVYKQYSPYN